VRHAACGKQQTASGMPDKVLVHLRESAIVRMRTLECGLSGLWTVDSGL